MKLLQATSLLFATLVVHAHLAGQTALLAAYLALLVTSLMYHGESHPSPQARSAWRLADKAAILSVVILGALEVPWLPAWHIAACVATFATCK